MKIYRLLTEDDTSKFCHKVTEALKERFEAVAAERSDTDGAALGPLISAKQKKRVETGNRQAAGNPEDRPGGAHVAHGANRGFR